MLILLGLPLIVPVFVVVVFGSQGVRRSLAYGNARETNNDPSTGPLALIHVLEMGFPKDALVEAEDSQIHGA